MKGKIKALFQKLLEKLGLKEKSFVNYISQGNSLPSPLTPDEEVETVKNILPATRKQDCRSSNTIFVLWCT